MAWDPVQGRRSLKAARVSAAFNVDDDVEQQRLPPPDARLRAAPFSFWRPDVVTRKTRPAEWAALRSRWRFANALTFYAGAPIHLLSRVWPPLLLNMGVAAVVAADHVTRVMHGAGFLPEIDSLLVQGLDPELRFVLIAVSLLQAMRLARVYERWWTARRGFAAVGAAALGLTQRVAVWAGAERPGLAEDVARWGVAWHYSVLQALTDARSLSPEADLTPPEAAAYAASRKGRQFAVVRLMQLLDSARFEAPKVQALENVLQRGVVGSGDCTAVKLQCMPYSLSLLGTGFAELFLVLLPLTSLARQEHAAPGMVHEVRDVAFTVAVILLLLLFINLLLLGADEVINQLENPFPWLPLHDIAESTKRDTARVIKEAAALRGIDAAEAGGLGAFHAAAAAARAF